jgi:hypothetical protein
LESDPYRALHHLNHDSLNVRYFPPPVQALIAPSLSHLLIHFLHFMYVHNVVQVHLWIKCFTGTVLKCTTTRTWSYILYSVHCKNYSLQSPTLISSRPLLKYEPYYFLSVRV